MRSLGDRLHSLGLKFGIYSSAGAKTCGRRAGSLNYEKQDLALFKSFGIDYLKYDNCYPVYGGPKRVYDKEASERNEPSKYMK